MNDRDTAGYDEIEPTGLNPAQRFDNINPAVAHGRPRPLARGRFGLRTRMGGGDPTPVITHRVGCPSSPMQASIALARAIGCYFDCDPDWGYCNPLWGPIVQVRSELTGCGVAFGACARHASTYQVPQSRRSGLAPFDLETTPYRHWFGHLSLRPSSGMAGCRCSQHSPEWWVVRFRHRRRPPRASVKGTKT